MMDQIEEVLSKLKVLVDYTEISSMPGFNSIRNYHDFSRELRKTGLKIFSVILIGVLIQIYYAGGSKTLFAENKQSITVLKNDLWGLMNSEYDLKWHGENEIKGKWMWRKYIDMEENGIKKYGNWEIMDVRSLND